MQDKNQNRRCDFCSKTSRPGLSFYKGDLSAIICSDCVKALMLMVIDHSIQIGEHKNVEKDSKSRS